MNTNKTKLISEFINKAVKVKRIIERSGTVEDKEITILQIQALTHIKTNPGVPVGVLAKELLISPSAVAQLTNRLTDINLIRRKNDLNDRRVIKLYLTDTGGDQVEVFTKKMLQNQFSVFANIPEDDLKQMIRIFTNILNSQNKSK